MRTPSTPHRLLAAAGFLVLSLGSPTSATEPGPDPDSTNTFRITLETVLEHDDDRFHWYHPRPSPAPREAGNPGVVITLQQHLGPSDHYGGLFELRRSRTDAAWEGPTAIAPLAARPTPDGGSVAVADVTPGWHAPTRRLLAVGCEVPYSAAGRQLDERPRQHQTAYAVHDPRTGHWTGWRRLEMPAGAQFDFCRSACAQWLAEPDGTVLLPVYFGPDTRQPWGATVVAAAFDGDRLTYLRHGTELRIGIGRGFAEPSITRWGNRYFLTLRNDERAYVTVSTNGLDWAPPRPWRFDDGGELGSHNTQQHWAVHSDAPHLVYTRRGAANDHIPRNRAPLFIARVDPDRLCVVRASERILVPERGAELGNFGVAAISPEETWVTVSEGVWSDDARRRGARGATFVARIRWTRPNRLAVDP